LITKEQLNEAIKKVNEIEEEINIEA